MKAVHPAVYYLGLLAISHTLQAQQENSFLGAERCQACHLEQYRQQSQTPHANALARIEDHPLRGNFFGSGVWRREDFHFKFRSDGGRFWVRASRDNDAIELPIEWAFGSGDQGVTFVARLGEARYLEHSFSWYSREERLALTAGQQEIQPNNLRQAIGLVYDVFSNPSTIMGCFRCHSTGPLDLDEDARIQPSEFGVRCEACHGPGRKHVEAVAGGDLHSARSAILNPIRLSADDLNRLCGECHRPPAAGERTFDFLNSWHVRHQPPYLAQSRCFRESQASLTCFTCHPPHEPIRRNEPQFYAARCMECHGDLFKHPNVSASAEQQNCIRCHMPRVQPQENLGFSNHWIGIYENGERLKPLR